MIPNPAVISHRDGLQAGEGAVTGRRRAVLRARLVRPASSDRLAGWLAPLAVAVVAGVLRFWRLGVPDTYVFDETYYAKDAWRLLQYGVEYDAGRGVPEYVVHPPAGKWVIAAGEALFGNTPFGWRFSVAVLGTLAVLMVARIARRMFGSTLLGVVAGLLLAVDGMAFVHSRTALLDPILMFFVLAAFGCLLIDRDHARARLGRAVIVADSAGTFGPRLGLRPWRLAAGVLLGLACATKWSGLWYLAVFGLMAVLWDASARKSAGARRPYAGALLRDAAPAFVSLVVVAAGVYLASWTGWFASDAEHAYGRGWAAEQGAGWPVPGGQALASLWHYHQQAYGFHVGLTEPHPYQSNPWSWLVLGRPVSYYYQGPTMGHAGCAVDQCSQAILAVGNPVLWWGSVVALPVLLALWAGRRDWRAGAILAAVAAGYLPWFGYQGRTIFSFYGVVFAPFLVLGTTLLLGMALGRPSASARRRTWGAAVAGAYVLLAVVAFAWLFPVLTAEVIPYDQWQLRMFLPSWV